MSEINFDAIQWKEFPLESLFHVSGSYTTEKNKLELSEDGKYPYITTAATNNGILSYSNEFSEIGGVITIDSAVVGTAFYQRDSFSASDHVEVLTPKFNMNQNIALFFCSVLNKNCDIYGYAYNEKRSQMALKKEILNLPVDDGGQPNYNFMNSYIDNLTKEFNLQFYNLKNTLAVKSPKLDISNWKKFNLYDANLFTIDMGSKLDKSKMKDENPSINFVGRSNTNNGITTVVDFIENVQPYKAGNLTLSLGGEYLGSCFIQPKDFYTSQNVVVLIPKITMSFNVKLFLSVMIFKESRTYYKAFIDELNKHIKTDFSFYLPVDKFGVPDWDFMDKYINGLMLLEKKNVGFLGKL